MRALLAFGLAALAGCARDLRLAELDRLERSLQAHTVALEDGYTLWSPFDLDRTAAWVALVDGELAASRELFGARPAERLMLVLVPFEGLGPVLQVDGETLRVGRQAQHPMHGIAGFAGADQVVVYVTPDQVLESPGGPLHTHRAAEDYRSTLRHELAHVHAKAAGVDGQAWLDEGLADLVESYALEGGHLVDRGPDEVALLVARGLRGELWSVERLLEWREDVARVAEGAEAVDEPSRVLCGLFVRFLVEREPPGPLPQRLRSVQGRSGAELAALDGAWRAWLDAAVAGLGARPSAGSAGEGGMGASDH